MAKSAHRFEPEMREQPDEPSRGSSLPDVRNISATGAGPYLMPRRPAPAKSDPFHATYVDERPLSREGMISGRFGRRLGNVPAGTRPTPGSFEEYSATTCHRHPRDRRPAPHARDWSTGPRPGVDHGYPAPSFDGSSASLGMRRDEVERHGRIVPDFYAEADHG